MADQKQTTVIPKLSARQQRALEVLLVGGSDQQAADVAGVTRPTIVAWRRKLTVFTDAIRVARQDLLRRTSSRLHAATALAVRALEEVARDTKVPAARVSAARAILELSHKAVELEELEQRVDELERLIREDSGNQR